MRASMRLHHRPPRATGQGKRVTRRRVRAVPHLLTIRHRNILPPTIRRGTVAVGITGRESSTRLRDVTWRGPPSTCPASLGLRGLFFCGLRLRFLRLPDLFNVSKIAETARCELRRYKVFGRYEIRRQSLRRINYSFNPPFPCRVKIDTRYVGKNI